MKNLTIDWAVKRKTTNGTNFIYTSTSERTHHKYELHKYIYKIDVDVLGAWIDRTEFSNGFQNIHISVLRLFCIEFLFGFVISIFFYRQIHSLSFFFCSSRLLSLNFIKSEREINQFFFCSEFEKKKM